MTIMLDADEISDIAHRLDGADAEEIIGWAAEAFGGRLCVARLR